MPPRRAVSRPAADSDSDQQQSPAVEPGHHPKRRKIRKGTHSCWACKRKKIRCTFSTPGGEPIDLEALSNPSDELAGVVCDGCRRRGTPCVSQELPETAALTAAANHSRLVDDRLGRMEALVEMLVKNAGVGASLGASASPAGTVPLQLATSPMPSRLQATPAPLARPGASAEAADSGARASAAPSRHGSAAGGDAGADDDDDTAPNSATRGSTSTREKWPAISKTGTMTPSGLSERDTPTYTTWFGHERGMDEDEQQGMMPTTTPGGPATPASTAATSVSAPRRSGHRTGDGVGQTGPDSVDGAAAAALPEKAAAGSADRSSAAAASAAIRMNREYVRRYEILASAWPSPDDMRIILQVLSQPERTDMHNVLVYIPFSAVLAAESPPVEREKAKTMLVLPPFGSHLVLIAHRLLVLASLLQRLHPHFDPILEQLSVPHYDLLQRAMCATSSVVTGNDTLIGSLEGVQCLIMQGVIQSNQGNLRRAWLAFRRAMTMAQLMGLHRGFPVASLSPTDPATGKQPQVTAQCLWFRIVYADRYLSLMLGLPQGAPNDAAVMCSASKAMMTLPAPDLGSDEAKTAFTKARHDLRTIELAHAVIAGRIIERNEAWRGEEDEDRSADDNADNALSTTAIDLALKRASRDMPAQWWLTPPISNHGGGAVAGDISTGAASLLHMQRLIDQLFHYHLLIQLHLPYMLRRNAAESTSPLCSDPPPSGSNGGTNESGSAGRDGAKSASADSGHAGKVDKYAYSKITCVSASREVLSRFLSLRSFQHIVFFCRSVDFFALLASMTLCLAHLDSHRNEHQQHQFPQNQQTAPNDFLAHQRLSDRGMMERVLESMEETARINRGDALSAKSAAFLRRMLDIEEDALLEVSADMGCTKSGAILEKKAAANAAAGSGGTSGDLRVWVPFLGMIRISKEGVLRLGACRALSDEAHDQQHAQEIAAGPDPVQPGATEPPPQQSQKRQQRRHKQAQQGHQEQQQQAVTPPPQAATVPPAFSPSLFTSDVATTYPDYAAGEAQTFNPLTGLPTVPVWSRSPTGPSGGLSATPGFFPRDNAQTSSGNSSNNTEAANARMFHNHSRLPSDVYGTPGFTGIDRTTELIVSGDGSGFGSGFESGFVTGTGAGNATNDWTLQGVDFAFFENLLVHRGAGPSATVDPEDGVQPPGTDGRHDEGIAAAVRSSFLWI